MSGSASVQGRMSRGVAWMAVFKVAERLIGLASMTVLARLLVPADFGLVVLATSMVALLELLGAFGLDTALIRQADATSRHYDAVWTFNLVFGVAVAAAAACLAPAAAWLYGDPRLVDVLLVLALARLVGAFESTGIVGFRKELAFDREVRFLLVKRFVTSLLVTVPLAFVLRSHWALVLGTLAGTCIGVALSYVVHPYRPRLSFERLGELMRFARWLFVAHILEFLHARFADFVIGAAAGPAALGTYGAAREVARLPSLEVAAPVNRAVFPGYVKLADDRAQLRDTYLRVLSILLLFVIPAAAGLVVLAEPAVLVLLGDRWSAAIPLIQVLALNGAFGVLVSTGHHVNLAVGMSRSTSVVLAMQLALSLPLILLLVPAHGAAGAAAALLCASVLAVPVNLRLLGKAIAFRARDLAAIAWRPLLGAAVMAATLALLRHALPTPTGFGARLGYAAMLVAAGALVYFAVILALGAWRRDPGSAEALVWSRMRSFARGAMAGTRHAG